MAAHDPRTDGLTLRSSSSSTGRHDAVEHAPERPIATVDEVFALADAVGQRHRTMVLVASFTGLRLGELIALTRNHVDAQAMTVSVTRQLQQYKHGELDEVSASLETAQSR